MMMLQYMSVCCMPLVNLYFSKAYVGRGYGFRFKGLGLCRVQIIATKFPRHELETLVVYSLHMSGPCLESPLSILKEGARSCTRSIGTAWGIQGASHSQHRHVSLRGSAL